ncbi:MAG: protoporphyrinogen oxidase HemJ [Alphaproteobacteria bacterium]
MDWGSLYPWVKALHIISVVAWMAGMLYLPRLYVYHCAAPAGSPQSETFKLMERRLLRAIVNPAMIATWAFGLILLFAFELYTQPWMHAKLLLVVILSGFHGFLARWRRDFAADRNRRSARFYRIANELPTVILVAVVILAVVKPF